MRGLVPGAAAKANQTLDAQLSMARLSERQGDSRTAEQIYLAVLKQQPQNQLALHRLGVLAANSREHEKAAEYLTAATRVGPPSAELLNDIGFNLLMMGRVPEAEAAIRQAIEIDPRNRAARNNLGLVLGETRRYDESLAEFRRAGDEAEAQANLAYAQTRAGDLAGARSSYHRALMLNNELKPAAEALVQLAQQPSPPSDSDRAQAESGQANASKSFAPRKERGAPNAEMKTLPELAQEGRTADFLESVTERERPVRRANAVRPSGHIANAVAQAGYIRPADTAAVRGSGPSLETTTASRTQPIGAVARGAERPASAEAAVDDSSLNRPPRAVVANGSSVLSRVFRFPPKLESAPATEIHRRATAPTGPPKNAADRSFSRLSTDLPNPAELADTVVPPTARPGRRLLTAERNPATAARAVHPVPTPRTGAVDASPGQPPAEEMLPPSGPTSNSGPVFATPPQFFSRTPNAAARSPWQMTTWMPELGAGLSAGAPASTPPQGGTVIPAYPPTNLVP
jgi:Tfp pilus assembly protein PilF